MYNKSSSRGQVLYISHGGGPLPLLNDSGHKNMIGFMEEIPGKLNKPDAVIVISAHWEESLASVTIQPHPALYYDYYGFPPQTYEIEYPVPGAPELAQRIRTLIKDSGMESTEEKERGLDHGVFVPLKLMYPEADIPVVQISLIKGLHPGEHLKLGKALSPLLEENILIIGSGFSFHNMRAFGAGNENREDPENDAFQDWLIQVCTENRDTSKRENLLAAWENAPASRYCHPREEHLLPLHVCCALAGEPGRLIFDDYILGKRSIAFEWS